MSVQTEYDLSDSFATTRKLFRAMGTLKSALNDTSAVTKFTGNHKAASIRTLKVIKGCYPKKRGFSSVSKIRLCGRWLEQAGFEAGESVKIITMKNLVIIVPMQS